MVYKYRFTAHAERDLDVIFHYLAIELDNQSAASAFMTKVEKALSDIRLFPKCGAIVDNEFIVAKDVRKIPIANYILYYRIETSNDCIVILRIIYGKRDPQQTMKDILLQ